MQVFRAAADRHGALFVVNDRADLAVASGADGVHLGQNDLSPSWARRLVGPDVIIGLSTHSTAEFDAGDPEADYLCVGPLYATPTKPGRPATGLEVVTHAATRSRDGLEHRPWFAIGGIDGDVASRRYRCRGGADRCGEGGRRTRSEGLCRGPSGGSRWVPRFLTIT